MVLLFIIILVKTTGRFKHCAFFAAPVVKIGSSRNFFQSSGFALAMSGSAAGVLFEVSYTMLLRYVICYLVAIPY